MITGHTRAAGVIGTPIRHSLSPAIFNAAFGAAGLDWAYLAFDVPEGAAGLALGGMRALGLDGLSVTMPHKAAVLDGLDELSPDARGARRGELHLAPRRRSSAATTPTARASIDSLRVDDGIDVDGLRMRGGRRRGRRAGRRPGARRPAARRRSWSSTGPRSRPSGRSRWPARRPGWGRPEDVGEATSSSTPRRWAWAWSSPPPASPSPCRSTPSASAPGQIVVDLVYHPPVTPLLAAARERGLQGINGLGMLIHQAAHAFRLWTSEEPPARGDERRRRGRAGPPGTS